MFVVKWDCTSVLLNTNILDFLNCFKCVYKTFLIVEYGKPLPGWSSGPSHMHVDLLLRKEYASFIVTTYLE